MKNILITGGAGFIGSKLALQLLQRGHNVSVLDNLSPQIHGKNGISYSHASIKDHVRFVRDDIRNISAWEKALHLQNVIVHLASETGTGQSMYQVSHYTDVNIQGTAIMLDYLTNYKHSVEKIVVSSSRAVYGEGKYFCDKDGIVFPRHRNERDLQNSQYECLCPFCNRVVEKQATDEECLLRPISVYGITKLVQEKLILTLCAALGISSLALRYQNVYGPGQSLSNPYTGILSIFSTQIRNGSSINVFEDGKESRDFIYIDDVVDATILATENGDVLNDVINIGSGCSISVKEIVDILAKIYKRDVRYTISGNYRLGDIRHNYADIKKAKKMLGFVPKYSIEEGMSRFVEWVISQPVVGVNFEQSIAEMAERGLFK